MGYNVYCIKNLGASGSGRKIGVDKSKHLQITCTGFDLIPIDKNARKGKLLKILFLHLTGYI
jgi:hypothetical protein